VQVTERQTTVALASAAAVEEERGLAVVTKGGAEDSDGGGGGGGAPQPRAREQRGKGSGGTGAYSIFAGFSGPCRPICLKAGQPAGEEANGWAFLAGLYIDFLFFNHFAKIYDGFKILQF
jgi:hypothetical protein